MTDQRNIKNAEGCRPAATSAQKNFRRRIGETQAPMRELKAVRRHASPSRVRSIGPFLTTIRSADQNRSRSEIPRTASPRPSASRTPPSRRRAATAAVPRWIQWRVFRFPIVRSKVACSASFLSARRERSWSRSAPARKTSRRASNSRCVCRQGGMDRWSRRLG